MAPLPDAGIPGRLPRVGVGVIAMRDGLVLLGRRLGAHGAGTWALPGGHLEFAETPEDCARRELREETGLEVERVAPGPYVSDVFPGDGRHYVTLFVLAHCPQGEPQRLEPERCAGWAWYRWTEFPSPLFQPLETLRRTGYVPV